MHFLVVLYIFLYHYWLFTRTLMYPDGCFCEVTHKIYLLIFCFLIGQFISKYFFTTYKYFLFRFTTSDTDSWFKTRELQHGDLKKQMETLQKDIVNMKKQKMTLFVSTTAFRRNLLDLLGKKQCKLKSVFFHNYLPCCFNFPQFP